jgi:hypothetical protein
VKRKRPATTPRARRKVPPDWASARKMFEEQHLSVSEIGRRLGCKRHTVARRRDVDGWGRLPIGQRAAELAAEEISRRLVAEQGDEILSTAAEVEKQRKRALRLNSLALGGLERLLDPAKAPSGAPLFLVGEGGSIDLTLRRLILNLTAFASSGLPADPDEDTGKSSEEHAAHIEAVLAEIQLEDERDREHERERQRARMRRVLKGRHQFAGEGGDEALEAALDAAFADAAGNTEFH